VDSLFKAQQMYSFKKQYSAFYPTANFKVTLKICLKWIGYCLIPSSHYFCSLFSIQLQIIPIFKSTETLLRIIFKYLQKHWTAQPPEGIYQQKFKFILLKISELNIQLIQTTNVSLNTNSKKIIFSTRNKSKHNICWLSSLFVISWFNSKDFFSLNIE